LENAKNCLQLKINELDHAYNGQSTTDAADHIICIESKLHEQIEIVRAEHEERCAQLTQIQALEARVLELQIDGKQQKEKVDDLTQLNDTLTDKLEASQQQCEQKNKALLASQSDIEEASRAHSEQTESVRAEYDERLKIVRAQLEQKIRGLEVENSRLHSRRKSEVQALREEEERQKEQLRERRRRMKHCSHHNPK